ncbi:MAG: hypothetical protein ACU843_17470, partial [Gammaproteobacteria bacterium]
SMKIKPAQQLFDEAGISLKDDCGKHNGRRVRWLAEYGLFQVGEDDKNFDRWANSVDFSFDLRSAAGQRKFLRWVQSN